MIDMADNTVVNPADGTTSDPTRPLVIGVDLGGTKTLGVLMDVADGQFRIHTRLRRLTQAQGNDAVTAVVLALLRDLMREADKLGRNVAAIGVGSPGYIHPDGIVVEATNLSIKDLPLAEHVRAAFALPTQVIHDVKAAALAESRFGAGRQIGQRSDYLAYIGLGTGIGLGLVLDGKVYQGSLGRAGEVGYVPLKPQGIPDFAVLEALAAGPAIAKQARHIPTLGNLTTEQVAEAARAGNAAAQRLLHTAADHIGLVLASLINVLDLNCVVVGGGMAQMGELFIGPIRAATLHYALPIYRDYTRIVAAALGNDAGAIGAGTAALLFAEQSLRETKR